MASCSSRGALVLASRGLEEHLGRYPREEHRRRYRRPGIVLGIALCVALRGALWPLAVCLLWLALRGPGKAVAMRRLVGLLLHGC